LFFLLLSFFPSIFPPLGYFLDRRHRANLRHLSFFRSLSSASLLNSFPLLVTVPDFSLGGDTVALCVQFLRACYPSRRPLSALSPLRRNVVPQIVLLGPRPQYAAPPPSFFWVFLCSITSSVLTPFIPLCSALRGFRIFFSLPEYPPLAPRFHPKQKKTKQPTPKNPHNPLVVRCAFLFFFFSCLVFKFRLLLKIQRLAFLYFSLFAPNWPTTKRVLPPLHLRLFNPF